MLCDFSSFPLLLLGVAAVGLCCGDDVIRADWEEMRLFAEQAAETQQRARAMDTLPDAPFDPRSPMPEAREDMSAAETDGGLFFDNDRSTLTYIGNVRFSDPRIQLRAANRVYLLLPPSEKNEAAQEIADTSQKTTSDEVPPADASEEPETQVRQQQPPCIQAVVENAAVDIPGNRILLEGRLASPSLVMHRETAKLTLQKCSGTSPAWLYATQTGDIILIGNQIVAEWQDSDGGHWRLEVEQGPVVYRAATRTLTAHGNAQLTSPRANLRCAESLCVTFAATTDAEKPDKASEPFAQFSSMQLREVERAEAVGNVQLTTEKQSNQPPSIARGDRMCYNFVTGDCLLTGEQCTLISGERSLRTNGEMKLLPNGDALISGDIISGSYSRPSPGDNPDRLIVGSYSTRGPISYSASENRIHLPAGLQAKDSLASFSCTGEADIFFLPQTKHPESPRDRKNLPNIAVAQQEGVARVLAHGDVRLTSQASDNFPACDLRGDFLDADVEHSAATITTGQGHAAQVHYGNYKLAAQSPVSGADATVQLFENGDLRAVGDRVEVRLPVEGGTGVATCDTELQLQREQALLTMGSNARIETPNGILTALGPLQAQLYTSPDPLPSGNAPEKRHGLPSNLSYNFTGLRSARTEQGGTVRTQQLSMQCEKLIILELREASRIPKDNPRDQILSALATGNVRLAGKDSTGRLMRADGDTLQFDQDSGNFYLRGSKVTLMDEFNAHTASGAGACVTIDAMNNVRISGSRQSTSAGNIHRQIDNFKKP